MILRLSEINCKNKRVIIREDFNVPIKEGQVVSDERIRRAIPTLQALIEQNAAIIVLSHLGRPKEGTDDPAFSLAPVAPVLSQFLGKEVRFIKQWLEGIDIEPGQIVLCENVRFNVGEQDDDAALSKKMAALGDVFVMDAFATAHRASASTVGIAKYAKIACAGPLLIEELTALSEAFTDPKRPLVAIVGGSKVSTKIQLLDALMDKVDVLLVGGGIANTFLAAEDHAIGRSLYEADWVEPAKKLLERAKKMNVSIPLPLDVRVASEFSASAKATVRALDAVKENEMILDVGPETENTYFALMQKAATIVWNGPVGVFEFSAFAK